MNPNIDLVKAAAVTPEEHRVRNVKTFRVALDSVIQGMRRLETETASEEVILARQATQNAVMWLGMEMKRLGKILGTPSPYPDGYKPENSIVNPTADGLKL
jgi:hypothetical protein